LPQSGSFFIEVFNARRRKNSSKAKKRNNKEAKHSGLCILNWEIDGLNYTLFSTQPCFLKSAGSISMCCVAAFQVSSLIRSNTQKFKKRLREERNEKSLKISIKLNKNMRERVKAL
jgi:hypothetical protein